MRQRLLIAAAALGVLPVPLEGQAALGSRIEAVRRAMAEGNHSRATALADSLVRWAPHHPNAVLIRAVALAAAGRDADAAEAVRVLFRWDPRYARRALQDTVIGRVRGHLHGLDVDAMAERADRPIARGHVWAVLEERDLVPEGTAWDPATRSLLVGSLNKNKVVAIAPDGTPSDRVPRGAHGLGSVVGIHVDSIRNVLWVTSTRRFDTPGDTVTPALFAFDAARGTFRRRINAPPGESFLNDLTSGPDGTVYVTDARAARVLVLRPGADAFETFADVGPLSSPNGITISPDGRHLFVSDLDHVQVVSLAERRAWRLAVPDSINLAGIDGLAFAGNALIAHHPLAFWRIVRYELDPRFRRVVRADVIERNTPDPRTSTTGEVVGDAYYYIGNGQIDRMNQRTIDSATMAPIRLYRAPLRAGPDGLVAVALEGADSVALLDGQLLDRRATLPVGRSPHEIAASRDGRGFYVANTGDSSISVLDVSAVPRVRSTWRLPDGISAHDVAVGRDGIVWAASGRPPMLLGINPASGSARHRYPLQREGSWMADPYGPDNTVVIANLEGGAVTLVAPATGRQTVLEGVEGEIDAIATPDLRQIWSVNYLTGDLTVFDARSRTVLSRGFSGPQASRVVFTPDGRIGLVVHGGDSTVVAYEVATRRRIASLTVGRGPKVIALSADGRRAYVSHPHGALTMIDVPSLTVLLSVTLPGTPDGVAVAEPRGSQ